MNIEVKICKETRRVDLVKSVIGNDGENLQGNIIFSFSDTFVDGIARVEYEQNAEKNYIILTKEADKYTLPIKSVLTKKGQVNMQLVITENENENGIPIFKSNVFYFVINDSINAIAEAPEGYDQWLEIANAKIIEIDEKISETNEALSDIDNAINETNNLDLNVSKENKTAIVTLTKKDATIKEVFINDGASLQFVWQGTSLGIKTDDMQDYVFVDLQGVQGVKGDTGEPFKIKKTYNSIEEMNADFPNMNIGDYVMIANSVETEDNAKLYTKGELNWIFITDFSGATGIRGEIGLTPNIQIGNVTTGEFDTPASVTRTGTNENPILNFVLPKGNTGEQGLRGLQGYSINQINKKSGNSAPGTKDTYSVHINDGNNTEIGEFDVYNGADGDVTEAQLNDVKEELESLYENQIKGTATGTNINIQDSSSLKIAELSVYGKCEQDGTPTPTTPIEVETITGNVDVDVIGKNLADTKIFKNRIINCYTVNADDSITQSATDTNFWDKTYLPNSIVLDKGTYTISVNNRNGSKLQVYNITTNTNLIEQAVDKATFTISEDNQEINVKLYGASSYPFTFKIQIEQGDINTNFEEYKKVTININLQNNELCSIGDVKDEVVVDGNTAKIVKYIGKRILNSANSNMFRVSTGDNYNTLYISKVSVSMAIGWSANKSMCSHFKEVTSTNDAVIGTYRSNASGDNLLFFIPTDIVTLDEAKAYMDNLNATFYSVLAEPYEIELGNVTQVSTYKNTTNITNNKDTSMSVTYYKDLETLINNLSN